MSDSEKSFGRHSQRPEEVSPTPAPEGLSETDKARIRAEEEYRAQVRSEQAAASAPPPMRSFKLEKGDPKQAQGLVSGLLTLLALGGVWWWLARPAGIGTTGGTVTYVVSSSCPVDVTYTVNGMDTQQEQGVPDGWAKTVPASSLTNTLIAQLSCNGTVGVGIAGQRGPDKTATSSGEFAIATVSYP